MISKTKISTWQAILLIILTVVPTTVLFIPSGLVLIIEQDAWLAVVLATFLAAVFVIYPLADLGAKFPGKNIIEYSQNIMGRFGGKIFGLLFCYLFFSIHCYTLREFGELASIFLPQTPLAVFAILISIVVVYAVSSGLEVIGRCAEIVFILGIICLVFVGMFNINIMDYYRLMPVMEKGMLSVLRATLNPLEWLAMSVVFGLITPALNKQDNLKKTGLIAIVISGLLLTVYSVVNTMVFGAAEIKNITFPLLTLARQASPPVFERIDVLIVVLWTSWIFIRAAILCYATVVSLSNLFNLTHYRYIIVPETILAIAYSIFFHRSFTELSYAVNVANLYYLFFTLVLPFILWVVYRFKLR